MVTQNHTSNDCTDPQRVVISGTAKPIYVTKSGYDWLQEHNFDCVDEIEDPDERFDGLSKVDDVDRDAEGLVSLVLFDYDHYYVSRYAYVVEVPCDVDWVVRNKDDREKESVEEVHRTWS